MDNKFLQNINILYVEDEEDINLLTTSFLSSFVKNIFVAYNLRFHPVIEKLRDILCQEEPALYIHIITGQYLPAWRPERDYRKSYSAHSEKGGGVLLDLSHELDYVGFLSSDIKSLCSIYGKISDLQIDSDDIFSAVGKTADGTFVNISLDYISKKPLRIITIHTSKKTITADMIAGDIDIYSADKQNEKFTCDCDRNDSYKKMHLSLLQKNAVNVCTFEEGVKLMKLMEEAKKRSCK